MSEYYENGIRGNTAKLSKNVFIVMNTAGVGKLFDENEQKS
jgi:hypothetical protein